MNESSMTRRSVLGVGAVAALSATLPASAKSSAGSRVAESVAQQGSSLSVEALGTLNRFHTIANQRQGDWDGMGIEAVGQSGDDGYHMQLPYMFYALSVAQHSRTPAYRELYKKSMSNLIEKMRRNEVWSYWEELSTGEGVFGSEHQHLLRNASADPIANANVMYSGHILPMLAMYEMFHRDGKWSAPGAFLLQRATAAGALEEFRYDIDSVQKNTVRQFVASDYLGMECFIDTLYPTTCLLFPLHGLIHYDFLRGTRQASDVIDKHIEAWKKISTLYHMDKASGTPFVLYPSRHTIGLSDAVALGKAQFMNVFAPEYTRAAYPHWRDALFEIRSDGMLSVRPDKSFGEISSDDRPLPAPKQRAKLPAYLTGSNEQLAHKVPPAALEMGDEDLAAAALEFANYHNPPVWADGELYYERDDSHGTPQFLNRRASILLGSGHVWSKDAYRNIYLRPWGKAELEAPQVEDVSYPDVLVSQAYYDASGQTLNVTMLPHGVLPGSRRRKSLETSFRVTHLDRNRSYRVLRDGQALSAGGEMVRDGGNLILRARLEGRAQTFRIMAV